MAKGLKCKPKKYAEGGAVRKETTDELLARMRAKYGGAPAAEEPAPAPPPQPVRPAAPPPQPTMMDKLRGLATGGLDRRMRAAEQYAGGGVVNPYDYDPATVGQPEPDNRVDPIVRGLSYSSDREAIKARAASLAPAAGGANYSNEGRTRPPITFNPVAQEANPNKDSRQVAWEQKSALYRAADPNTRAAVDMGADINTVQNQNGLFTGRSRTGQLMVASGNERTAAENETLRAAEATRMTNNLNGQLENIQRMRQEFNAFDPSITDPNVREQAQKGLVLQAAQRNPFLLEQMRQRGAIDLEQLRQQAPQNTAQQELQRAQAGYYTTQAQGLQADREYGKTQAGMTQRYLAELLKNRPDLDPVTAFTQATMMANPDKYKQFAQGYSTGQPLARAEGGPIYAPEPDHEQAAMSVAQGRGLPVAGRLLQGAGTPKSDSLPAVIDGEHPAELSTDEFVMPVEVVRYFGLAKLNAMIEQAKKGLQGKPSSEQGGN